MENMIEVHNKIDLLPADAGALPAMGKTAGMAMSCKTDEGVDAFLDELAAAVLRASGQIEEEYIVPLVSIGGAVLRSIFGDFFKLLFNCGLC